MGYLTAELFKHQDIFYKSFSKKLIPDTNFPIIGVRVPKLKELAKECSTNDSFAKKYLSEKHVYYEEWFLHGILLGYIKKDLDILLVEIDAFLPHIDNWAICDSSVMNLKIIKKQPKKFLSKVEDWLRSDSPYIIRFAIVILLSYFLDKEFNSKILDTVANITSQNYYVKMAVAWFFSIALIKQYDKTVVYLENRSLSKFIHNKTIQKALESYRISVDKKLYLKELKY